MMMGRRRKGGGVLTVVLTGFDDEEMVRALNAIFKRLLNIIVVVIISSTRLFDERLSFCLTRCFDASSSSNRCRFSATCETDVCARAFFSRRSRAVYFPRLAMRAGQGAFVRARSAALAVVA